MSPQAQTNKILTLLAILFVFILGALYLNLTKPSTPNFACTLEAKICPDGSSVGRSGPKCEFAVCPESVSNVPVIPTIPRSELEMGWYFGSNDQKKSGTPNNWDYTDAGRNSCWHKPGIQCIYLPD